MVTFNAQSAITSALFMVSLVFVYAGLFFTSSLVEEKGRAWPIWVMFSAAAVSVSMFFGFSCPTG